LNLPAEANFRVIDGIFRTFKMALQVVMGRPARCMAARAVVSLMGLGQCGVGRAGDLVAGRRGTGLDLGAGVLVLAVELLNNGLERVVDLVSLEQSELARQAKDAGSAGVAVAGVAVGVAWVVVLLG
jgi:hypothetical protein